MTRRPKPSNSIDRPQYENPAKTLSVLSAASVALNLSAQTSDWTGGDGNWSSNDNPGWNGTGVPNAVGAVANFSDATAIGLHFTTNVDIPATVGSINFNANGDFSRTVITVNSLTMNNGGSGGVISNSNPSTGTNNFLVIASGVNANLVLADDLLVINTSGSTAPADAILIGNLIQGTGNVTFSTVGNTVTDQLTAPGCIKIIQAGTFVGNVLVQKGAILTNAGIPSGGAFGDAGNMVTLGQAGQGSVTVMATANNVDMPNPFTVAAGHGRDYRHRFAQLAGVNFQRQYHVEWKSDRQQLGHADRQPRRLHLGGHDFWTGWSHLYHFHYRRFDQDY